MPTRSLIRVLVVDDDEDDYILTREILHEISGVEYEVAWASGYEEGLAEAHSCGYDVYLVDYRLGGYNGLDLLRAMEEVGCEAPVIVLTGFEDRAVDIEATLAGASDYLLKNRINAPLLERAIRYAIGHKTAEAELRRQANQQNLIADISTRFANLSCKRLDAEINAALQQLGEFTQSDRCHIFQFRPEPLSPADDFSLRGETMSNTHEWCAPDIEPQKGRLQKLPFADFPWATEQLQQLQNIIISDVNDLPAAASEAQQKMRTGGVRACVLVPVGHEGDVCGFIGLEVLSGPRQWSEDTLVLLKLVGEIIAAAIHRVRDENELRQAARENHRLATAIDKSTTSFVITDPNQPDNPIIYVNRAFTTITGYEPHEVLGNNCRFLTGTQTDEEETKRMRDAIQLNHEFRGVLLNYRKDGSPFWNELVVSPVRDAAGRVINFIGLQNDVTERVESQIAVRASEERFRALTENASDIVLLLDGSARILYASSSTHNVLGYRNDELPGVNVLEFVAEENHEQVLAQLERGSESNSETLAVRCRHADGSWHQMEILIRDLRDNAAVQAIVVNARDVTERHQNEQALRASEARHAHIAANVPGMIYQFVLHPDGSFGFPYLSEGSHEIYGASPEAISSNPMIVVDAVYPDEREAFHQSVAQSATKLQPWHWEGRYRHLDGELRWMRAASRPQPQDDGSIMWDGLMLDITAEKRAEEELRQSRAALQQANDQLEARVRERTSELQNAIDALRHSEDRYRILARNFPNGALFLFDRECRYQIVGGSVLSELGYVAQEMEGRKMNEVLPRRLVAKLTPIYDEILRGESHSFDLDSEGRTFAVHTLPVRNEAGEVYAGMIATIDITQSKRIERDLQAAKEEAERANRAKSEFLSRMSHELRTPLNSILGFGQLLERSDLSEKHSERASLIVSAGRHLLDLINEVLDIARIEAGHMSLSLEPVSVEEVVREVVSLTHPLAERRDIQIEDDAIANKQLFVLADRQRIKQVLLNVVANAIKYNREGGRVMISCRLENNRIHLAVRDTGPGIASEAMERLFTPFDRLGAERSEVVGTGLGLALSQRLMSAMNGKIEAASENGDGTTFTLILPSALRPQREEAKKDNETLVEWTTSAPRRILYIEDNLANLALIESIFSELMPFKLLAAMQGGLGLELARNHQPDLVLLDLHLPDMNGDKVLEAMKSDPALAHIPVVMLSADATPGQVRRLMEAGADEYLTKPLDIDQFLRVVNDVFSRSK